MKRTFIMVAVALLAAASGQSSPTTILTVDIENLKYYTYDVADYSRLATDPKGTTPPREKNFATRLSIGDIVAVNGQPAKDTWVTRIAIIGLTTNPAPGEAIADTEWGGIYDSTLEILRADGTPVGTIMTMGLAGAPLPRARPCRAGTGMRPLQGGPGHSSGCGGNSKRYRCPPWENTQPR